MGRMPLCKRLTKTWRETESSSPLAALYRLTKAKRQEEKEAAPRDDITGVRHHMVHNNGRACEGRNRVSPAVLFCT